MLLENIYMDWWGQESAKKLQINKKNYTPSYLPGYGEFKNLCFISVAWMVSVSRAFVYNGVDVKKIATAFLAKPPPQINAQSV